MSSASGHSRRLTRSHRVSITGVAALGAASLALTLLPGGGATETGAHGMASVAMAAPQGTGQMQAEVVEQHAAADKRVKDRAAREKAAAKAKADAQAKKRAGQKTAASRTAARKPVYANNLNGWIREALAVMKAKGIPGSYNGLHRNIMRESTGNPRAKNGWDINARNGTPSIGLLQVIQPTFNAYHVSGTPHDIYHPVSNIVAAANYAAARYGSIDNVNGAY